MTKVGDDGSSPGSQTYSYEWFSTLAGSRLLILGDAILLKKPGFVETAFLKLMTRAAKVSAIEHLSAKFLSSRSRARR